MGGPRHWSKLTFT